MWHADLPVRAAPAVRLFSAGVAPIGHRGLGRGTVEGQPENSAGSVAGAVAFGLPWVELDVTRTADDILVASHSPTTPAGAEIAALTAAEATGQGVSLVRDLLEQVPADVGVVLDVKPSIRDSLRPGTATTAALVAPLARDVARRHPCMVYGFDPTVLLVLRDLAPEVPRGLLTWVDFPFRTAVPAAVHLGAQVVAAHTGSFLGNRVEPRFTPGHLTDALDLAHRAGLEVVAWCPGVEQAPVLVAAGVDALCLDAVPSTVPALTASGLALALTSRAG